MNPTFIFGSDFNKIVLPLIRDTRECIDIVIFDWRFDDSKTKEAISLFNTEIIKAVKRGVIVRAIVNSPTICQRLLNLGVESKIFNSKKLLHTKLLILDKCKLIIGSHNYTQSAFDSNYELSTLLGVDEENNKVLEYFNNLWSY